MNRRLYSTVFRIPVLAFDTCVFGAALYKGVQELRGGFLKDCRLMWILLRDSLVYFVVSVSRPEQPAQALSHAQVLRILSRVDAMVVANVIVWSSAKVRFRYDSAGGSHILGETGKRTRCNG